MKCLTVVVATLVLAGCGGSTPVSADAPPAVASSGLARLTIPAAAKAYETAVGPLNAAAHELSTEMTRTPPDLAKVKASAVRWKAANRMFLDFLTHTPWPVEVQTDVDAVARSVAAEISWADEVAAAKSAATIPQSPQDNSAAQVLRAKLGLGTVPNVG